MSATSSLAFLLRRMAPLALCGALALALAACGGDDPVGFVPIGGPDGGGPSLLAAPTITKQPASLSVAAGATAAFEVTATGSGPLDYQWLRDGTAIAGATSAKLTLPAVVTADDKAKLSVVVSNAAGSATSADALLNVTTSIPGGTSYPTLCTGPKSTGWCWVTAVSGTAVAFSDAMNGVLVNGQAFFRTTDGGSTWFLATANAPNLVTVHDVHFATPTLALAVGQSASNAPVFLRSTDAGVTWNPVSSGVTSVSFGVSFGSATVGAAVGVGGDITYTADGGQTWARATAPALVGLESVAFASASVAVAVGANGTILRSTDSGMTWSALPAVSSSAGQSIKFVSATTGFFASGDGLRRSDDAGLTWTAVPGTVGLRDLDFGDALHGVAVGQTGKSVVTSDGGVTWTSLVGAQPDLRAVAYAGTSTVVVLGQAIQRSTDSGKTWGTNAQTVDFAPPSINALRFADATTAVAVGGASTGFITRTTDGGGSWAGVISPTNDPLVGIDFASPSIGVAVGAGVILRSVDGGAGWTVATNDPGHRLNAVRFASATVGIAVGQVATGLQGLVLRTTDAGATWSPVAWPSGITALTALAFGSATVGVIGDNNGKLYRTTDGGLTWSPVGDAGAFATVSSITFADATTALAVGTRGFILRSADGGATWSPVVAADPMAPDAVAIRFASPTLGYMLQGSGSGIMKRSVDGGKTWSAPFPRLPAPFTALDFADAKHGLIGCVFSTILRTTTAGQ